MNGAPWWRRQQGALNHRCTSTGPNATPKETYFHCYTVHVVEFLNYYTKYCTYSRSQWPHGLRRRSAAARLVRSWVRIPPVAWMSVCCECCVLSGRGLCDELITRPEESYRLWCVVVCDQETSRMRRPWPALGRSANKKNDVLKSCINYSSNNAIININYGRLQELIFLYRLPVGTRKDFFDIYRQFGHAPSKRMVSPSLILRRKEKLPWALKF